MVDIRAFSSPLKYQVSITRCPNTTFFVQSVTLPGLTIGTATAGTPFSKLFFQGDHLTWGTFDLTFKLDAEWSNWYEIQNWIIGQGFPRNFGEYQALKSGTDKNLDNGPLVPPKKQQLKRKDGDIYSQIILEILTSKNNPIVEFQFKDAFPVALSPLELDSTKEDVEFLTASVTFKYTYYTVIRP